MIIYSSTISYKSDAIVSDMTAAFVEDIAPVRNTLFEGAHEFFSGWVSLSFQQCRYFLIVSTVVVTVQNTVGVEAGYTVESLFSGQLSKHAAFFIFTVSVT